MDIATLIHINRLLELEKDAAEQEAKTAKQNLIDYYKEHDCSEWDDLDENAPDELKELKKCHEDARARNSTASLALNDWYHHDWH